ncbi:MAG TPA: methyltransferase domain-containing protein [Gaiellaceae bacterium]
MWPTEQNRAAWEDRFGREPPAGRGLPEAVRARLPDVDGKHVLHLGCGTGEATAELRALGALVSGIDPSAEALAVARERAPDAAFFQAELHELPLQLQRRRFAIVYAGDGTLARVPELGPLASAAAAALRKNGRLVVCDRHPVLDCVDPVGLRWRESYFDEGRRRLGQIVTAFVGAGLTLLELEELPPPRKELGGRHDPRVPAEFLLQATSAARA